jgi:hypothetical protein
MTPLKLINPQKNSESRLKVIKAVICGNRSATRPFHADRYRTVGAALKMARSMGRTYGVSRYSRIAKSMNLLEFL